jgi:putative ABC transport system substrate-binding protein
VGIERLPQMAAELVQGKVDVIMSAAAPASVAAKAATVTIPIVIVAVSDPVKTGLIASHARLGGNVTGLALLTTEMSGKRLELLQLRSLPSSTCAELGGQCQGILRLLPLPPEQPMWIAKLSMP